MTKMSTIVAVVSYICVLVILIASFENSLILQEIKDREFIERVCIGGPL